MEPRADSFAVLDCVRAPGQGQECILEGMLDVMLRAEDIAAEREDHRTVTLYQDRESVQVTRGDETLQKLSLRQ
jgi:hypothetical protein